MAILSNASAGALATVLSFARVASTVDAIFGVQLPDSTHRRQLRSLQRRGRTECVASLPIHTTHLSVCLSCKRVATSVCIAMQDTALRSHAPFVEVGARSCLVCADKPLNGAACESREMNQVVYCARRPSAAMKTAAQCERNMEQRRLDCDEFQSDAFEAYVSDWMRGTAPPPDEKRSKRSRLTVHVRRDFKNVFVQPAVDAQCSNTAMLNLPLLGRVVRVFGSWYTLCPTCAAPMQIAFGITWAGHDLCCLQCDTLSKSKVWKEKRDRPLLTGVNPPDMLQCRFCGVVRRLTKSHESADGWRCVDAPLDVAGRNAKIPSELRKVFYCRSHFRAWLVNAHQELQTRVILSHLAHNARPI